MRVAVIGCVAASACLGANPGAGATDDLPPEVRALLDGLQPRWKISATTHGAVGFKDNVVLSHADPQASGFARGGVDMFIWHPPRLPAGRIDYFSLVKAETTQFFRREVVDHEGEASIMAEWRYRMDDVFSFALDGNGLYFDQVLDVSDTDIQRVVVASKKTVGMIAATMRWAPRPWWWVEFQGSPKIERYRDDFNNARATEGTLQLGWRPTRRFEARAVGTQSHRRFSTREQYTAGGRPDVGTALHITEREVEARFDFKLDAAAHWKATTRLGHVDYRDNGSGFFNYRQKRIRQRIEWESAGWTVRVEGSARRRDFAVQTVGVGLSPPLLVREKFDAEVHVERKINERWSVYLDYVWERSRCNEPIASYRMNEGLLGATWSWEK